MAQEPVYKWDVNKVTEWLSDKGFSKYGPKFSHHKIDGRALLLINETDLKTSLSVDILGDLKRLSLEIRQLKHDSQQVLIDHGYDPHTLLYSSKGFPVVPHGFLGNRFEDQLVSLKYAALDGTESDGPHPQSSRSSEDGHATILQPEVWKTLIALGYLFAVTWITAFVMVIVHERVPDMKKYPPLPDIFLDNVPHIPWAFHMCEWTGAFLLAIWICVLLVHKHRFILLRRFFALSGTVFLLRCVTMLITSLSVPGTHLDCNPRPPGVDGESEFLQKVKTAYRIWKGAGMSIQGVRTCGDYMFSGHTVALTMLNFFITEYSPREVYLLHTFTWLLNMFGIFFILSGHEHYSIDVFIAFYITSRLFLYYHTLANNQSLMQRDQGRTRIWFPLFSFFESDVDGIVPNEYESPVLLLHRFAILVRGSFKRILYLFVSNLYIKPTSPPNPSTSRRHKKKTM